MKIKLFYTVSLVFIFCLLLSSKAFASVNSDIEINITSPIDSLQSESGMVAIEHFPEEISIQVTAKTGTITDIQLEYGGQSIKITPEYIFQLKIRSHAARIPSQQKQIRVQSSPSQLMLFFK